jgi:carbonic anhydrase
MKVEYKPQQSPIDLAEATQMASVFPPGYLELQWPPILRGKPQGTGGETEFTFENLPPNVGLTLGNQFFKLLRFHFHAPSEHTLGRREWPLELHIVHAHPAPAPEEQLFTVLGIWVEPGPGKPEVNRFFRELTERLSAEKSGEEASIAATEVDPHSLLPAHRGDFYRYEGSLTTEIEEDNPETVSWVIFRETQKVDQATLSEFITVGHRAKAKQGVNRRFVLCSFIPSH